MHCLARNPGLRCALPLTSLIATLALMSSPGAYAQTKEKPAPSLTPLASKTTEPGPDDETIVLSPFVVSSQGDDGYLATSTLAGTRLKSELKDTGSAIQVVTSQFLRDTATRSVEDLLVYTTSTEIGGVSGNFSGVGLGRSTDETGTFTRQNTNSRVRGLAGAENTRDFFITDIPWDGYNVGRVDIQRGPNSILFGLGSPAGIVNAGLNQAAFKNSGRVEARFDQFGSIRGSLDLNHVLLKQELAVRLSLLRDRTKFRQQPAYNDDDRVYGAVRYEPKFLQKHGSKTAFRANYEEGDITAERPRTLPPIDRLTPWFATGSYTVPANNFGNTTPGYVGKPAATYQNLNRAVFNNWDTNNFRSWVPNSGIQNQVGNAWIQPNGSNLYEYAPTTPAGTVQNPTYQPWISEQFYTGVVGYFDPIAGIPAIVPANYSSAGTTNFNGLNSAGQVVKNSNNQLNGDIQYFPGNTQTIAITEPWKFAKGVGLPFYANYRDPSLTDAGVFDFYNHLLDGATRRSWRNFHTASLALDQTFFNNRAGFNLAYDKQNYSDGQNAVFTERNQAINVDVNGTFAYNNQPNPNAGRAMLMSTGGSGGGLQTEREEKRLTVFGDVRAEDFLGKSMLTRILGKHVFTGLASKNRYDKTNQGWQRFLLNPADVNFVRDMNTSLGSLGFVPYIYLSGDLRDPAKYPAANSLHLTAPEVVVAPKTVNVTYFDSNWKPSTDPTNASYVNPGALWINPFSNNPALPTTTGLSTQSENPANYVGFVTKPVRVLDAENPADREQMITSMSLARIKISTKAFVWQGFFFDGNIVPTFGYREDTAKSYTYNAGVTTSPARAANGLISSRNPVIAYPDQPGAVLSTRNRSWSIVAHSPQFIRKHLPWGTSISLTYNTSSNFNPNDVSRSDFFGRPMAPSAGKTRDVGVLISALDNRINFRVIKFNTVTKDIGFNPGLSNIMQLESRGWVVAKRFEAGLNNPALAGQATYNLGHLENGQFVQSADERAKQASIVTAVLGNVPQDLYKAWNIDTAGNRWETALDLAVSPPGVTSVQDRTSQGWEYELNVRPTPNWSITANVAKISATTDNNLRDVVDWFEQRDKFWQGPAGDVPYPNGLGTANNRDQWNANVAPLFAAARILNGEKVQEMTPTRFNVVTNYSFKQGRLKGVNVGGAYRWDDKAAIGYKYAYYFTYKDGTFSKVYNNGNAANPVTKTSEGKDLSQPVYGKTTAALDLWVGYERKVTKTINWKIQANVRGVGDKNSLVPIGTNPDGSLAQYRIMEGMSWSVTNTLSF